MGKDVVDKLAKEEKENDKLWTDLGVKDREIEHLQKYQSQVVELTKQLTELGRDKLELEKKLIDSKKNAGTVLNTYNVFRNHCTLKSSDRYRVLIIS